MALWEYQGISPWSFQDLSGPCGSDSPLSVVLCNHPVGNDMCFLLVLAIFCCSILPVIQCVIKHIHNHKHTTYYCHLFQGFTTNIARPQLDLNLKWLLGRRPALASWERSNVRGVAVVGLGALHLANGATQKLNVTL